jgi:deoxyribodipyrimidine photo-lyase
MEAMEALSVLMMLNLCVFKPRLRSLCERPRSEVYEYWKAQGVAVIGAKDHVIFEKDEVVKGDGTPYLVFSPYAKMWRKQLDLTNTRATRMNKYFDRFHQCDAFQVPSLAAMNFERTALRSPVRPLIQNIIKTYDETRNFPAQKKGTTRLGLHLRFGTFLFVLYCATAYSIMTPLSMN